MSKKRKKIPARRPKRKPIKSVPKRCNGEPIGGIVERSLLGERMTAARVAAGLSASAVARLLDVSQPYVTRLETGVAPMSVRRLVQWAAACQVDPAELVQGLTPKAV